MAEYVMLALYALQFIYWPFLFIRMRDIFVGGDFLSKAGYEMTRKKIIASLAFAVVASVLAFYFNIMEHQGIYFPFVIMLAFIPVITILSIKKDFTKRTKIKIIIVTVYFHVAWQMLPKVNIYTIATDLILFFSVLAIAKINLRRHKVQHVETTIGSISELWE